eukprot:TRINITY_DN63309_c0_g1_i1.p1 TRINITY_DN63309_c0_g1~~TRINITY_DN63309_c0_g1_i1.p1  ORF type:complete len:194 (+),score=25.43 TRINITY_DN63309_c0_g1_i1:70-651(+)
MASNDKSASTSMAAKLTVPLMVFGVGGGVYAGMLSGGKWAWFSWHPLAMMVAFVTLASQATILKKAGGYDRTKKHGNLMSLGLAIALFGWYVIWSNKEMASKPHLTSWHSWVGFFALVSWIVLAVVGLLGLHPDFGFLRTHKRLRLAHKWGGRVAGLASWLACWMGFAKMNPNPIHQFLFAAPLLGAAGFVFM